MKKLLVVGSNGFAGSYLKKELLDHGYEVYGVDLKSTDSNTFAADMLVPENMNRIMEEVQPDGIFNLSGFASPHLSWEHVLKAIHLNVDVSVNLALAMKSFCPKARFIVIGSANQYDFPACHNQPISELSPCKSDDPYSVSKQAQESLLQLLAKRYELDIMMTRSFNHIGPRQQRGFVVSDFASGIVDVERGLTDELRVGNLDAWRDFSDVRDTVRAYRLLYEKGHSGEIYNVGSGKVYHIRWILETLLSYSTASPRIAYRQMNNEMPAFTKVLCDPTKLYEHTGYCPQCDMEATLRDVLLYYRNLPSPT
ncbi:MAG: GDP-mannose 4,6-dehydratase [Eubacteriales bacterium]|nr:GDP-mannose 4,6-dehydratase [Eubacteriales bacterium]